MAKTTKATAAEFVAELCLYGGGANGAGYIARTKAGKMFGDGTPAASRSLTDAMWLGVLELQAFGVTSGLVRVFEPTGLRVASMRIDRPVYFGELSWSPAPVYVLTADAIAAASDLK